MICPSCGSTELFEYNSSMYDDRHAFPGFFSHYRCQNCEHLFLNQSFSDQDLQRMYSKYYPRAQNDLSKLSPMVSDRGIKGWLRGDQAQAASWVPARSKVLDVGCGFGESLLFLREQKCDVYGVDADVSIVKVAEKFRLNAKCGLLNRETFAGEKFDFICMNQVLEHVPDISDFLEILKEYLNPTGKIIFSIPNYQSVWRKLFGRLWIHWHVPYHLHFFSRKSLSLFLDKNGLEVEKQVYVTPSDWFLFQQMHIFSNPKPKIKNPIWNHMPGSGIQWTINIGLKIFHRLRLNSILYRLVDALKMGDNLVVIVRAKG